MLRFENVDLHYGSFRALEGITLHADAGELVVLLGANGAGKTSIFMAASGIQKPSRGSIRFDQQELVGMRPAQIVQSGLVHCPEGRKLFPLMSVRKNLELGAYVHRSDKAGIQRSIDEVFSLFPILATKQHDAAAPSRAASSRWWRSAARWWAGPRCCCSTNPRWASRRWWSSRCSR